jgi:hypothetical protein
MKKIFAMLITAGCFAGFHANAQVNDMSTDTARVNTQQPGNQTGDQNDDSNLNQNRDRYNSVTPTDKNDMIKIRISELPSMVTQTLGNSDYAGWTIVNAYRTKGNDQYLVEVKKGSQTRSYWFDKNGNRLENKAGTHKSGNGASESGSSGTSGAGSSGTGTSGTGTSGTGSGSTGNGSGSGAGSGTTTPDR